MGRVLRREVEFELRGVGEQMQRSDEGKGMRRRERRREVLVRIVREEFGLPMLDGLCKMDLVGGWCGVLVGRLERGGEGRATRRSID